MLLMFILVGLFLGSSLAGWNGAIIGALFGYLIVSLLKLKESLQQQKLTLEKLQKKLLRFEQGSYQANDKTSTAKQPTEATSKQQDDNNQVIEKYNQLKYTEQPNKAEPTIKQPAKPNKASALVNQADSKTTTKAPPQESTETKHSLENTSSTIDVNFKNNIDDTARQSVKQTTQQPQTETEKTPQKPFETRKKRQASSHKQAQRPNIISKLWKLTERFFTTGNPIVKVASIILFFGVGFLLKYAADNQFFPIQWRLISVALVAIGLLVWSFKLPNKHRQYSLVVQGAAIGILYLTVYAAGSLYQLIPLKAAFVLLFILAVVGTLLALKQNAPSLAIFSVVGGFLAPILTSSGSNAYIQLFSYYSVLNLGILAISLYKSWRHLCWLGFFFTFFIGSIWGFNSYQPNYFSSTEPFLVFHFILYLAIPILFLRNNQQEFNKRVQTSIIFGLPTISFAMQLLLVKDFIHGDTWSALAWSVAYFIAAGVIYKMRKTAVDNTNHTNLLRAYLAIAVTLFSIFIFFLFDKDITSVLWAFEAVGLVWLGLKQQERLPRFAGVAVLGLAALLYLANYKFDNHGLLFFNNSFIPNAILVLAAFSIGLLYLRAEHKENNLFVLEKALPEILSIMAFASWILGGIVELYYGVAEQLWLNSVLIYVALSCLIIWFASQRLKWPLLAYFCLSLWPALVIVIFIQFFANQQANPFAELGFISYLLSLVTAYLLANKLKQYFTIQLCQFLHTISLVSAIFLISWFVYYYFLPTICALIWTLEALLLAAYGFFRKQFVARLLALVLLVATGLLLLARVHLETSSIAFLNIPFMVYGLFSFTLLLIAYAYHREFAKVSFVRFEGSLGLILLIAAQISWYLISYLQIELQFVYQQRIAGFLILVALTCLAFAFASHKLNWRKLAFSSIYLWLILLMVTFDQFTSDPYASPHRQLGWLYYPLTIVISYLILGKLHKLVNPNVCLVLATINLLLISFLTSWLAAAMAYPLSADGDWYPIIFATVACCALLASNPVKHWLSNKNSNQQHFVPTQVVLVICLSIYFVITLLSTLHPNNLLFIPVLNPLDLSHLLIVYSFYRLARQNQDAILPKLSIDWSKAKYIGFALAFIWLNIIVARSFHHLFEVPFNLSSLFASPMYQATISILWSLLAVLIMFLSKKYQSRNIWLAGIAILSAIIIKLIIFDMDGSGTLARIVSFLAVGAIMLAIGYFAPMPPKSHDEAKAE